MATTRPAHRSVSEPQVVRRARPPVSRRAALGGLLVAVAMVATFGAYSSAGSTPTDQVVVAERDVAVGQVIGVDDVRLDVADLPEGTRSHAVTDAQSVVGAVALAPLTAGDLVQRRDVLLPDTADPDAASDRAFSLPVDRDRAVEGDLAAGERVDVLATYGTGESAYTVVVARRARVTGVRASTGGLGSDERVVVGLALATADETLAVTHAGVAAVVTLVRTTRAPDDGGLDRYAPPARATP